MCHKQKLALYESNDQTHLTQHKRGFNSSFYTHKHTTSIHQHHLPSVALMQTAKHHNGRSATAAISKPYIKVPNT